MLESAGIPSVRCNAVLVTESGAYVATRDAWLDDVGLAIEVDSVAHHSSPDDFARTLRRNARSTAAGVLVLGVLPVDLRDRPSAVLHEVIAARAAAGARSSTGDGQPTRVIYFRTPGLALGRLTCAYRASGQIDRRKVSGCRVSPRCRGCR